MEEFLIFTNKEPFLVDSEFLGVDDNQLEKSHFNLELESDKNAITINTSINIPAEKAHNHYIPEGSFYRFEGKTECDLSKGSSAEILTATILENFETLSNVISQFVNDKTNGQKTISLKSDAPPYDNVHKSASVFLSQLNQ